MTEDDGGTEASYNQTQYDRQRIAQEQCNAGNNVEVNCSYAENHPYETAAFAVVGFAAVGTAAAVIAPPTFGEIIAAGEAVTTIEAYCQGDCSDEARGIIDVGQQVTTVFRGGGTNPGNLTPRASDNGALSFRSSLSNPWPLQPGQNPVFKPGQPYFGVDISKLPGGSVVFDNIPPGHVSIINVVVQVLKDAVIEKGVFPQ
jgi:hypothetical protein